MKKVKLFCAGGVIGLALLQFTNPTRTNPPVQNDFLAANSTPAGVAALFRGACYDCHSSETKWPWYGRVAPVSWGVVSDVNHARARLALSSWPINDRDRAARKLEAMIEEIRSGDMPPLKYSLLHPDARLTTNQRRSLVEWLSSQAEQTNAPITNSIVRPATSTNATAASGMTLFLKNCAHCHGADARGDEGPDLHHLDWTDEQILTRIHLGKKSQMTAFAGKLSEDQIFEIKDYLRTLQ